MLQLRRYNGGAAYATTRGGMGKKRPVSSEGLVESDSGPQARGADTHKNIRENRGLTQLGERKTQSTKKFYQL